MEQIDPSIPAWLGWSLIVAAVLVCVLAPTWDLIRRRWRR